MPEPAVDDGAIDVVCPHCKKPFRGALIAGAAARYEGFKCPHCRLFVPYDRVGGQAGQPGPE